MSKTSIAVIVLALLLVLSLVMGMTGAWFTAQKNDSANNAISFGKVGINATETLASTTADFLPGDQVGYELEVDPAGTTVDVYVFVGVRAMYKIGDTEYTELYNEGGDDNLLTVDSIAIKAGETNSNWAIQDSGKYYTHTEGSVVYKGLIYKVTYTDSANKLKFAGKVALAADTENAVYPVAYASSNNPQIASGNGANKIVLNDGTTAVSASFGVSYWTSSVQAKNLTGARADGQTAYASDLAAVCGILGLALVV